MKSFKFKTVLFCSVLASALAVNAQVFDRVYHQQFDYTSGQNGNSFNNTNFPGEGWTNNTGVITYQHGAGLTYPGVTPSPTGGAMVYDSTATPGNRNAIQTDSFMDYGDFSAGQVFEFSALIEVERANFNSVNLDFITGQTVNNVTFGLNSSNMFVTAWMDGNATTVTGDAWSLDTTNAFLMRVTQGSGASPTDSLVEIWFNPDYGNLGAANFTSTSDTRIGRSGEAYTSVRYSGASIGNARVIWDEVQVVAIPEPGTLALVGIALAALMLFRRRA